MDWHHISEKSTVRKVSVRIFLLVLPVPLRYSNKKRRLFGGFVVVTDKIDESPLFF